MATYRTLNHVRERLTIVRGITKDPEIIAALDESIAELDVAIQETLAAETPAETKDENTKELTWGQRFAIDNFLHDLRLPPCQMGIWS